MAKKNGVKGETSEQELSTVSDIEESETIEDSTAPVEDVPEIDDILNSLKSLLSSVEKLQKVRQEVGDIKPLIGRMLDGELLAGEELEQLKTGVSSLSRLVRAYGDHQAALAKAQPARNLLDQVLKERQAQ
jgi:Fic family protein